MKVHGIILTRAQYGWICDVYFTVTTARQFTREDHSACGAGKNIAVAVWRAWRHARHVYRDLKAKPGERKAKGWAA